MASRTVTPSGGIQGRGNVTCVTPSSREGGLQREGTLRTLPSSREGGLHREGTLRSNLTSREGGLTREGTLRTLPSSREGGLHREGTFHKQGVGVRYRMGGGPNHTSEYWKVNVYVPPRKRVHKRRFLIAVLAVVRLLLKTRRGGAPLNKEEKLMTTRLYYSVPPMLTYPAVTETLSLALLSVGVDDIIKYLARAGYHPGSTVTYKQFEFMMMQLKKQYQNGKLVPDSEVAFVALGGGDGTDDRGGEVQTEQLINVCQTFRLTIDIQKFIDENDEDGSGLLDFGEFDAMFKAAAASKGSAGDGSRPTSSAAPRNAIRAIAAMHSMKTLKGKERGSEADLDKTIGGREDSEDGETKKQDNETVIEGINYWTEHPPEIFIQEEKSPSPGRGGDGKDSVPSTADEGRTETRGGKRSKHKKARQAAKKRLLWESGREGAGKEERSKPKVAEAPTFNGSAKRFYHDQVLTPLPPAKGSPAPTPKRPHPRDKEVDFIALVEKLRRDDESRASYQSHSARRAHHNNTRESARSRATTARTGTAPSDGGPTRNGTADTLPPIKPHGSPSYGHDKKPKRWYSYNPFDSNEGGDPCEDPLTEGGYSKDRQKNRLPGGKRRHKTLQDSDSDDGNGMGGEKEDNSDLDSESEGSDSDAGGASSEDKNDDGHSERKSRSPSAQSNQTSPSAGKGGGGDSHETSKKESEQPPEESAAPQEAEADKGTEEVVETEQRTPTPPPPEEDEEERKSPVVEEEDPQEDVQEETQDELDDGQQAQASSEQQSQVSAEEQSQPNDEPKSEHQSQANEEQSQGSASERQSEKQSQHSEKASENRSQGDHQDNAENLSQANEDQKSEQQSRTSERQSQGPDDEQQSQGNNEEEQPKSEQQSRASEDQSQTKTPEPETETTSQKKEEETGAKEEAGGDGEDLPW